MEAVDQTLANVERYGLTLVLLVLAIAALVWLVRADRHDKDRQIDYWRTIASGAVEAIDRLTDELAAQRRGR